MKYAALRIDERLFHRPGDPRRRPEAQIEGSRLRRARADVRAGSVAAADRHRDPGPQAQMAGRFLRQPSGDLAAGVQLREFFRVQPDVPEHFAVIFARFQIHEHSVGGVGKIGRVHISAQAVDQIVLRLQKALCFRVDLRLLLLEPQRLAERRRRAEDVAGDVVKILAAKLRAQPVRLLQRPRVRMDHCRAQRLPVAVHRQTAEHVAADADGLHLLDVLRHQLPQHHHCAYRAHPPVRRVLLTAAAGQMVGRIGRRHVAQNVQVFVHERGLQSARSNIKSQKYGVQFNHLASSIPKTRRDFHRNS